MAQQLQERTTVQQHKGYRGLGMEGWVARWYTKNTGRDLTDYHRDARRIAERTPDGGRVLDLAPGPGYVAIEVARLGQYQVVGLDISETFVQIASERAREAGVAVDFQRGDAAQMPFADGSFDVVFCRAAFKNFSDPVGALREIYRVLKPGGTGLIVDLHKDVPRQTLDRYVTRYIQSTRQGWLDVLMTRLTFRFVLIPRAYRMIDFERMAQAAGLPQYEIREEGIGLDVWISK
jgi:ubiquinone/menaquinone biosynthesis C-methylase UbiE